MPIIKQAVRIRGRVRLAYEQLSHSLINLLTVLRTEEELEKCPI